MEAEETSAVANEFLGLAKKEKIEISNLKLIKLMYIAQGLSLSLSDRALFPDPIEAWKYGPVISSIYHEFKHFGRNPIKEQSVTLDKCGEKRESGKLFDGKKRELLSWLGRFTKRVLLKNWLR